MKIIQGSLDFELNKDTAVAIGKFDGLHLGHRKLLEAVLEKKKQGLLACVLTFDPSPSVFFGFTDGYEINTREEKRALFETLGVDVLVEFPMRTETAKMPPEVFVEDILVKRMHTKWMIAGRDVSFGDKGAGNATLLEQLSSVYHYELVTIDKVQYEGEDISSTRIRKCLEKGQMDYVERLLGMPYSICGTVVHGRALGRKLGMPTVNIVPGENKLLPPCGVYFSEVVLEGKIYPAISNIGYKPTVNEEKMLGVETYLYDFNENIYEKEICVRLLSYKRPEMQFATIEELKKQMAEDIRTGKDFHMGKKR